LKFSEKLDNAHNEGYISPEFSIGQISQVLIGLQNYTPIDVRIYADKKYSTHWMRIIRILLERGLNSNILERTISIDVYTPKQYLILGISLMIAPGDIDTNIRFVKKCEKECNSLYDAYRSMMADPRYKTDIILKSFDLDLNIAKISWLSENKGKSI
jgi:hypothetical protein